MLKNDVIYEVRYLLKTGQFSQREIARRLGISNTLVSHIEHGRRKAYRVDKDKTLPPEGPVTRCKKCGSLVHAPCVYCQVKAILAHRSFPKIAGPNRLKNDVIEIQLKGEEKKRYEEVREWRSKQKNPHFVVLPEDWPWSH